MQHLGEWPAQTPVPASPSEPSPQAPCPSDGPRAFQSLPGCWNGEASRMRAGGTGGPAHLTEETEGPRLSQTWSPGQGSRACRVLSAR